MIMLIVGFLSCISAHGAVTAAHVDVRRLTALAKTTDADVLYCHRPLFGYTFGAL